MYMSVLQILLVSWIDVLQPTCQCCLLTDVLSVGFTPRCQNYPPSLFIKFYSRPKQGLELPAVSLERARSIHSNLVLSLQLIIRLQPMVAES